MKKILAVVLAVAAIAALVSVPAMSFPANSTIRCYPPVYYQPNGYTCGPTSLRMVLAYYGKYYALSTVSKYCWTTTSGTSHSGLLNGAKVLGLPYRFGFTGWTTLKGRIALKRPCVIHMGSVINPGGGHYTVCTGLTSNSAGSIIYVYLNDPSSPNGKRVYTGSYFNTLWSRRGYWGLAPK